VNLQQQAGSGLSLLVKCCAFLAHPTRQNELSARRFITLVALAVLKSGVIAGAADDDPCGIATYSIVSASSAHRSCGAPSLAIANPFPKGAPLELV
jgi:hypothetical protein